MWPLISRMTNEAMCHLSRCSLTVCLDSGIIPIQDLLDNGPADKSVTTTAHTRSGNWGSPEQAPDLNEQFVALETFCVYKVVQFVVYLVTSVCEWQSKKAAVLNAIVLLLYSHFVMLNHLSQNGQAMYMLHTLVWSHNTVNITWVKLYTRHSTLWQSMKSTYMMGVHVSTPHYAWFQGCTFDSLRMVA